MIGYIANSVISLLNFFATDEGVRSFMVWGMGSFGGVSMKMMPWFAPVSLMGLMASLLLIKPLNALMLGDQYAENLGINIIRTRNCLLVVTGVLTAVTTAFCGPVAFIGLAVPHIAPPQGTTGRCHQCGRIQGCTNGSRRRRTGISQCQGLRVHGRRPPHYRQGAEITCRHKW